MSMLQKWVPRAAAAAAVFLLARSTWMKLLRKRCAAWEARQQWLESGVRQGCESFFFSGGDQGSVLLVHGFGDSPSVWKEIAPLLADAGFNVRAMRLPGFCEHYAEREHAKASDWMDAVLEELDAMGGMPGPRWIAGHSLGGAVALRTVIEHRPEVAGVALFAPLIEVSRRRSPLLPPRAWYELARNHVELLESPFADDLHRHPAPGRPEIERFIPVCTYTALFETIDAIRTRARDLTLPLWTAISPYDKVADPAAAETWHRQALAAPRRRLVRAAGSGHVLPLDHDAPALAASLVRFMDGK